MSASNGATRRQPRNNIAPINSRPHTFFGSQSIGNIFGKSPTSRLEDLPEEAEGHFNRKASTSSSNISNHSPVNRSFSSGLSSSYGSQHDDNYSFSEILGNLESGETDGGRPLSSTSIIKEGYMNKKVDLVQGSVTNTLTRSWKLYYVTLRGAKLSFFKPPTEAEIRHSIAFSAGNLSASAPLSSSPNSIRSNSSARSPSSIGMPLIAATFDSNAREMLFESSGSKKPLADFYQFGDCFTEVDVLHFKFKRFTCLLIFDKTLMVFKRRWIKNSRVSIFGAMKMGSSGNINEEKDPNKGYFSKWKYHATYSLNECDVVDASSTVFNSGNSSRSQMFTQTNASASSISTLSTQSDYSAPLASGKVQAFQLFIRDKVRTTRLFVAASSESKIAWTSKLSSTKEPSSIAPPILPIQIETLVEVHSTHSKDVESTISDLASSSQDLTRTRHYWGLDQHPELALCPSFDKDIPNPSMVSSGSIDALIHEAIFATRTYRNNSRYRESFCYTYPLFTSSKQVLQELERLLGLFPDSESDYDDLQLEMKRRSGEFIAAWLTLSGYLISQDILDSLKNVILTKLPELSSRFGLLTLINKLEVDKRKSLELEQSLINTASSPTINDGQSSLSSLIKTGLTPSVFLKMDPMEFAQQLYAFHFLMLGQHLNKLEDARLLLSSLSESISLFSCTPSCPHFLTKLLYHHLFFATPSSAPSRRALILNQWIHVGHMARDLGDMASWIAIAQAVCSPVVTRLSETWRSVDKRLVKLIVKRWVPVLVDLGLFAPDHPGKSISPKCMILLQEPSSKRSATKFVIPFFGSFRHYVDNLVKKDASPNSSPSKENVIKFENYYEAFESAQALRNQWPYALSAEAYNSSQSPFSSKKVYLDYFTRMASSSKKDQGSFVNEMMLDYDLDSLFNLSSVCESLFVDDYLSNSKNTSRSTTAAIALKFPQPLNNSPLFIDLVSSHFPLTNDNVSLDSGSTTSSFSTDTMFRKRTQSAPVSAYPGLTNRDPSRKANHPESFEHLHQLSKLGPELKQSLILVRGRNLVLFKVANLEANKGLDVFDSVNTPTMDLSIPESQLKLQICAGSLEELVEILVLGMDHLSQSLLDYKEATLPGLSPQISFNREEYKEIFFCTYRSFSSPMKLFELLKENFNRSLSKLVTESKPSKKKIRSSIKEQLDILDVFSFWISFHFHDFLDSPKLLELLFVFLHSLSEKMANILDDSVRKIARELHQLCETRSLTPIVTTSAKSKEDRLEPTFKSPYAHTGSPIGSMENLVLTSAPQVDSWDINQYSEVQLIDSLHHFVIPMLKKASVKDYLISHSLLEAQSVSTWSWLSSSKPLSYSEDETVISDIFTLLDSCRRRCMILNSQSNNGGASPSPSSSAPNSIACDRVLVSLLPRPISDLWQFRDKIRNWTIQLLTAEVELETRVTRIIKLIKMIVICRRRMAVLAPSYCQRLSELMDLSKDALDSLEHLHPVPSFVERGLISGIISPESRSFTRAWTEVTSRFGVGIDDLGLLVQAVDRKYGADLPQIEGIAPCVGWVFESSASIIRSLSDHSTASTEILNFSKRIALYKLLQVFADWVGYAAIGQADRRGFNTMQLLSGLEALKRVDLIKVKQIALAENGSTGGYASSIYYYATGSGSSKKIFGTLLADQLDKQKLENRERERVMREVKSHQLEMLRKQQEQAKLHDKHQKEQQVRKAKTKELAKMASLFKSVQGTGDTSLSLSQLSNIKSRKPVHVIKLINSRALVEQAYTKRDFVLRIITEEGGQFLLQCLDQDDMVEWSEMINQAAQQAAARRITLLAEDARNATEDDNGSSIVSPKSKNLVFGVSINEVMADGQIPLVIRKCISEVESRGLEEIGIYRVPGSTSKINALCRHLDQDAEAVDLSSEDWQDINVVACTLKQFLRDLPEPIATYELYDDFINAVIIEDYDERLFAIKDILPRLPPHNYLFLRTLIEHLERVTDYEEINHMYATNLAIVFGPTIFRPPPSASSFALSMANLGHQQNLVKNLVLQYHWLFDIEAEAELDPDTLILSSETEALPIPVKAT